MITLNPQPAVEIEQFRCEPFCLQQTFVTPLQDLPRFVSTLISLFDPGTGFLSIDQVVFEPKNLLVLAMRNEIIIGDQWHLNLTASGKKDIGELLEAASGDWVDFLFVPIPQTFAIYADHDEYTTFFVKEEDTLNLLTSKLCEAGFQIVGEYRRPTVGNWT